MSIAPTPATIRAFHSDSHTEEHVFETPGQFNRFTAKQVTRGALKMAALARRTVSYSELGEILGTFAGSGVMNRALYDLVEEDIQMDGPIYSALVVSDSTNQPGDGFFSACHALGARYRDRSVFVHLQQLECFKEMQL